MRSVCLYPLSALLLCAASSSSTFAQGTAFSYQGEIADNGSRATGSYDLRFTIHDSATDGLVLGAITNAATEVLEGVFTVTLDFGAAPFDGGDRWLELGVVTNGGGAFATLSPRQPVAPVPYAIRALNSGSSETVSGTVDANQLTGTIASDNIAAGTITSLQLAAGAVGTDQLADGAVTANKIIRISQSFLVTSIFNPTPAVAGCCRDEFGRNVAAVGADKVLIGADGDDTGAEDAGAAYLFGTDGTLLTTFTNPMPSLYDAFGVSVAAVGADAVLIGADLGDAGVNDAGAAYLYATNGTLLTTFTNPTPDEGDLFGCAVSGVGGDRVIIGAYSDDTGATNAGAAYLFKQDGTLLTTFTNPAPTSGDAFGVAVAAVGENKVVIGALLDVAYLFNTNGALLTTFTNPTAAGGDGFGVVVSGVGADKVVIGAPYSGNDGVEGAGLVHLFSINGTLLTSFVNPTPATNDYFGSAVAGVGTDRVLIGASRNDTGAEDAGVAYLFGTDGILLTTWTNPTPALDDLFGSAVAALGTDRVVLGAPLDDTGAEDAGAAYIFDPTGEFTPGLVAEGVIADSITSLEIADGSVIGADVADSAITTANLADGAVSTVQLAAGAVTADKVSSLDAGSVTSGTLSDARLSVNVARLDATQTFTGNNLFNAASGSFTGDGSGLTALNASQLTLGTVPSARIAGIYSSAVSLSNPANSYTGDGSGLTALNASQLSSGTVASARISGSYNNSVSMGNSANVFSGTFRGNATAPGSAPSFTWVGDTDSGLFRSGANTVALATDGTERLRITSSGDVGIGTAAPEGDLHVRGASPLGSLIVTPGVSDSDSQLLLTENTSASLGGILRYDGSANQLQLLGWDNDVATAPHVVVGRNNGNLGLGTGSNSVDARLHVQANNARVAKFDRFDTDGQLVAWARNDSVVGDVVVLAGNVTYNAFTGSHYAWCEDEPRPGSLMSMTGDNRPLHADGDSEIVYGVKPSTQANDPACLGTYMGTSTVDGHPLRLVAAVGNGEMWVVDTGPDIRPGDLLISSATPGCARVDDPARFAVGHVIARAAESVDWDDIQPGQDGLKQAKISVLYGPFTRGSRSALAQADSSGSDGEIAKLREQNRELRERLAAIEAVLGGTRLAQASTATEKEGMR